MNSDSASVGSVGATATCYYGQSRGVAAWLITLLTNYGSWL